MTSSEFEKTVEVTADLIRHASHCVVITGAGVSTPSNIPDFRSAKSGLWEENNPLRVASLSTFRQNPSIFYNWLRPLLISIRAAKPNPTHVALAALQKHGFIQALITQNIDGLHEAAGSKDLINIHGSLDRFNCLLCHSNLLSEETTIQAFLDRGALPLCSQCGAILKPAITLYEEMLPADAWDKAFFHATHSDLIITVGTSLEVYPVNLLPEVALDHGADLVINTLSSTPLDDRATITLPYDVVQVWERIEKHLLCF